MMYEMSKVCRVKESAESAPLLCRQGAKPLNTKSAIMPCKHYGPQTSPQSKELHTAMTAHSDGIIQRYACSHSPFFIIIRWLMSDNLSCLKHLGLGLKTEIEGQTEQIHRINDEVDRAYSNVYGQTKQIYKIL
jgi:hypothetical protein